jgi:hypothetical protein
VTDKPKFGYTRRTDGTVSVGAEFSSSEPGALEVIRAQVSSYASRKAGDKVDLLDDLVRLPRVEADQAGHVLVIFDGKAGSELWRDWMVECTADIKDSISNVQFEGFVDLVERGFSGTAHDE